MSGWRASASDSEMPASTSLRTCWKHSLSLSFSAWSSSTYRARRSDMPDEIIVESCRVATVSSWALTFLKRPRMSPTSVGFCSSMSRTIRPLERSCAATDCLSSASISPRVEAPVRSSALNAKVDIALGHPHRAHQTAELLGARGARLGELAGDLVTAHEVGECSVHRLHAVRATGLEGRVDLVCLALADQVPDRRRGHQDLGGAHAALPVRGGEKLLRDDPLQRHGELHADLVLLRGREHVDDAVNGLRCVLRVQGGEHEVAGLRGGQRGGDRLEVAHLAHEDHVRVLAQGGFQAECEGLGVRAQLALVHDAVLVMVEELDRVL